LRSSSRSCLPRIMGFRSANSALICAKRPKP